MLYKYVHAQCTGGILSVQETRRRIWCKVVWRSYKRVPRESPTFYHTGDNIRNWTWHLTCKLQSTRRSRGSTQPAVPA